MLVASIQGKLKKPLHIIFIIKIEFTYKQGEKKPELWARHGSAHPLSLHLGEKCIQKDREFEVTFLYIASLRPTFLTKDPASNKQIENPKERNKIHTQKLQNIFLIELVN